MGLPLRRAFVGMIPFALVAFVQFYRSLALLSADRRAVPAWLPKLARSGPAPWGGDALEDVRPTNSRALPPPSGAITSQPQPPRAAADSTPPLSAPTAAAATTTATASDQAAAQSKQAGAAETPALRDVARDRPPPTLSTKRLLDGGPNWLPVPNAEGAAPDDLAWQQSLAPNSTGRCPPGRRPYHTILTAQRSLYQEWQTKIFYFHFLKARAERSSNPNPSPKPNPTPNPIPTPNLSSRRGRRAVRARRCRASHAFSPATARTTSWS